MARRSVHISLQRKVINKSIFVVAIIEPLGTIPQILTIYTRHNATSISITSWLLFVLFDLMWLWYGINEKQRAVMVSGAMFAVLEGIVAIGAILYGGKW